jgi:hypothetical protein
MTRRMTKRVWSTVTLMTLTVGGLLARTALLGS